MDDQQQPQAQEDNEPEVQSTGQPDVQPEQPVEEPAPEVTPEQPEEPAVEEEEPPVSHRESKRIAQLLEKMKARDEPAPAAQAPVDNRPIIPEGDYDLEDVNKMAREYSESAYKRGLSEAQAYNNANTFATRLELDTPKVAAKYKFLDQDSDEFDPGRADFVNRLFLTSVGYDDKTGTVNNNNLRYHEFVEGMMEMVEITAAGKTAESAKNVAQQAAATGVRPSGTAPTAYQGLDPKKMTDAQLDAIIAQSLPRK